jgi:uncharacterized protein with von Willebrand factor type A (vWA) domain
LLRLLGDFIGELRAAGIPVSMTEHVDAARAIEAIDLSDRELFRACLGATLVKSGDHQSAFNTAFDVYFALRARAAPADLEEVGEAPVPPGGPAGEGGGPDSPLSAQEIAEMLYRALRDGDTTALRRGAAYAVARFAGMEPGRPVGGTYYLYRTLRNLDLEAMEERLAAVGPGADELAERLARDEARARVALLKGEVERIIRERLVEDRGAKALAKSVRAPLPEDLDVMHANRDEMAQLERALRPLSRKLAVRLARRRRQRRRGPIDLRHTVRRSLSSGGVPMDLRFKPPRPAKPEIFVVADVSGSVASFARFTLHLVHAISSQFSKVRSFVFVDGLDEVTALFEGTDDPAEAVARINAEADVIAFDGHSDYGRALATFHDLAGADVTRRTTILILGDARNNYHQAHPEVLADLRTRAKALYWLNPEPRSYWNSGDSIVASYEPFCDEVIECRTLRQLEAFVGGLS